MIASSNARNMFPGYYDRSMPICSILPVCALHCRLQAILNLAPIAPHTYCDSAYDIRNG